MPRAVLCHEFGPPDTLVVDDFPEKTECQPHEVVLRCAPGPPPLSEQSCGQQRLTLAHMAVSALQRAS